jgi:hypothetical protein
VEAGPFRARPACRLHARLRQRLRVAARPCQLGDAHGILDGRPSAVPGLLVRLDLQAVHQPVEPAEQVDHRHELEDRRIIQTQLLHRRSVNLESVSAPLYRRHNDRDDLLGEAIELARGKHDGLDFVPVGLEVVGVSRHHPV